MTEETQITTQEEAVAAEQAERAIIHLKTTIQGSTLELGKRLKEFKDGKQYLLRGYNTVNEWLSSPEVTIAATWASHAITMYEFYVLKLGRKPEELQGIDYTKLYNVLPMIKKHPEQAEEWINKAKELRRIDLQSEIKTQKISDRVETIETLKTIEPIQGVIHGDPVTEVKKLADNSIDLVITAPDPGTPPYVLQELFSEFRRVVKPNGSVFFFVDHQNLVDTTTAMGVNDYRLVRDIVLVYNSAKHSAGLNTLLPYHEMLLWASRGDQLTYNFTDVERDVWTMNSNDYIPEPQHPMEKPIETILQIIKMASDEGQTVLDPFCGSGTIAIAAKTLNRNFIAIEEDELWYKLTLEKIHTA
jgi:SAM-dependent methyltransferase